MGNPFLMILAAIGLVVLLAGAQMAAYFWLEGKDDRETW